MTALPDIWGIQGLAEIGRGGFGVVYRGRETDFGREVAVKVLSPTLDERMERRFERERMAMGALSAHPNIVTVYRGGVTDAAQPYLVMEYLPGGSLSERLRSTGPLTWPTVADIGVKLAGALDSAHQAGVLHRDVKPGNVFMTARGEPKLGDFGIARLDDGQDSRSGSITASVAHAAPEIVDGQRGDERSDLYSLASTLYALAAGHAPFSADPDQGLTSLLARIANEPTPPLDLEPRAAAFEAVLMKALQKNPIHRQHDLATFARELQTATTPSAPAPVAPVATTVTQQSPPVASTVASAAIDTTDTEPTVSRLPFVAGVVVLALVIAGLGGWAASRAFGDRDGGNAAPLVVVAPEPTAAVVPTPTGVPSPTSVAVPTATTAPASTDTAIGFQNVTDATGAISVDVPIGWTDRIIDADNPLFDSLDTGLPVAAISIGGDFAELGGNPEVRDLERSGIVIYATRFDTVTDRDDLPTFIDAAVELWGECELGEQSQLLLDPGNAEVQLLACDDGGVSAGVLVMALVARDDPFVVVSITIQLADENELDDLVALTGSLRVRPELVPQEP